MFSVFLRNKIKNHIKISMKNNILNNIDNYKNELDINEQILFLKYIGMIHELVQLCVERILIKNDDYIKHILITGIKNTTYIYKIILLYTKNIELALYHTQKSILYYMEFISQIGEDSQNLLKLTTKDASLFIYKKTIFEINDDYKKDYKETDNTITILKRLKLCTDVYNSTLIQLVSQFDLKNNTLNQLQKNIFTKLYKIVEVIIQLPIVYKHDEPIVSKKMSTLIILVEYLNSTYHYHFINNNYLYLIEYCIKKMYKMDLDVEQIKKKLLADIDIEAKLLDCSVCKIFNYLVN